MTEILLKHGADVEARDVLDKTPLLQAAAGGNLEAGRRLC
jgi:ankyrin repeat protein